MKLALLGYGRFGRALGALLSEAGLGFLAYDPFADIPVPRRATSLPALTAEAEFVVVAVPVTRLRGILEDLRPHLRPSQLVMDVGSVKVKPVEVLAAVLGSAVPWVGTHPLFGPISLAKGERPLRTVVCPNPLHPEAARRVSEFFARIGCEVIEQTPEAHDRVMAHTHALPFFMARGMLEVGMGLNVPFAPASFEALSRLIDVVRADAGHLFEAVQDENPYAREARRCFIEALIRVDRQLDVGAPKAEDAGPAARLPEQKACGALEHLDRELLTLLARRVGMAGAGRAAPEPAREEDSSREARRRWAGELGLDEEGVEGLFRALASLSRRGARHDGGA